MNRNYGEYGDRQTEYIAKQIILTEKGITYSGELLASLREMERCALRIMGNDRVQQMVDSITLYNTLLEKEMEKEV